jgi:hypothetical protein
LVVFPILPWKARKGRECGLFRVFGYRLGPILSFHFDRRSGIEPRSLARAIHGDADD